MATAPKDKAAGDEQVKPTDDTASVNEANKGRSKTDATAASKGVNGPLRPKHRQPILTPEFIVAPRRDTTSVPVEEGAASVLPSGGRHDDGTRSGNGGNGPQATRAAIEKGFADPVTGNAFPDGWGRDASVDWPTDPEHSDESIREDVAAGRIDVEDTRPEQFRESQ